MKKILAYPLSIIPKNMTTEDVINEARDNSIVYYKSSDETQPTVMEIDGTPSEDTIDWDGIVFVNKGDE